MNFIKNYFHDSNEQKNVPQNRQNAKKCYETPPYECLTNLRYFYSLHEYFKCIR